MKKIYGMVLLVAVLSAVAAPGSFAGSEGRPPVAQIDAEILAKVAELSPPGPYGRVTVLESPVFGPDGKLYFVNLYAAADQAKIARLDLKTQSVENLYSDNYSVFSSIRFSPHNGNIYVCDYQSGKVHRFDLKARKLETTFDGMIGNYRAKTDDVAFDKDGNMYLSDENGTLKSPVGRLIRLDPDGHNPTVVYEGFAGGNGIAFAPDFAGLWVSEFRRSVIDYINLSEDGKSVADMSVGVYVGGGQGELDSITVDSAGNIYEAVWGSGRVMIYSKSGDLAGIVRLKDNLPKPQLLVTHVAIRKGSLAAYITVGGENGGYIYRFNALASGTGQ
jgi:lactonase